jgi:hypothetical protein
MLQPQYVATSILELPRSYVDRSEPCKCAAYTWTLLRDGHLYLARVVYIRQFPVKLQQRFISILTSLNWVVNSRRYTFHTS